jgi:hypothetical protein
MLQGGYDQITNSYERYSLLFDLVKFLKKDQENPQKLSLFKQQAHEKISAPQWFLTTPESKRPIKIGFWNNVNLSYFDTDEVKRKILKAQVKDIDDPLKTISRIKNDLHLISIFDKVKLSVPRSEWGSERTVDIAIEGLKKTGATFDEEKVYRQLCVDMIKATSGEGVVVFLKQNGNLPIYNSLFDVRPADFNLTDQDLKNVVTNALKKSSQDFSLFCLNIKRDLAREYGLGIRLLKDHSSGMAFDFAFTSLGLDFFNSKQQSIDWFVQEFRDKIEIVDYKSSIIPAPTSNDNALQHLNDIKAKLNQSKKEELDTQLSVAKNRLQTQTSLISKTIKRTI